MQIPLLSYVTLAAVEDNGYAIHWHESRKAVDTIFFTGDKTSS
jgi:hypothetical protein